MPVVVEAGLISLQIQVLALGHTENVCHVGG